MSGPVPHAVRVVRFRMDDGTPVTVARGVRLDGPLGELVRKHAPEAFPAAPSAAPLAEPPPVETPTAPLATAPTALAPDSPASADEASTAEAFSRRKTTTR